jgi:hypothetical protein
MGDGALDSLKQSSPALAAALTVFSIVGPLMWNFTSHIVSTRGEEERRHYELLLKSKQSLDETFSGARGNYLTLCNLALADTHHQLVDGLIAAEGQRVARSLEPIEERRKRNQEARERNAATRTKAYDAIANRRDVELGLYDLRGTSSLKRVRRLASEFEGKWTRFAALVERDAIERGRAVLRDAAEEAGREVRGGASVNLVNNLVFQAHQAAMTICGEYEADARRAYYALSEALSAELANVH